MIWTAVGMSSLANSSRYSTVRFSQGTMPMAFGFTGTRLDASGLNQMGERFYDPVVGQFVSADQTLISATSLLRLSQDVSFTS